jgi:hypothetical protein
MVIFNNDTQADEEEEVSEHQAAMVMAAMAGAQAGPEPNTIGLVGDINGRGRREARGRSSSYLNWWWCRL